MHATARPDITAVSALCDVPAALAVLERLRTELTGLDVQERVTRSQISFSRRRVFAILWCPGRYLRSAVPAVLSIALPYELRSPRIKQIAHPVARTWMHHLELHGTEDLDEELLGWLHTAYAAAA